MDARIWAFDKSAREWGKRAARKYGPLAEMGIGGFLVWYGFHDWLLVLATLGPNLGYYVAAVFVMGYYMALPRKPRLKS